MPESTEEEKCLSCSGRAPHRQYFIQRSSFEKLVRIIAWVVCFVNNLKALKATETKLIGG